MTLRTMHADGTVHFSDLKYIGRSGQQYLASVNGPRGQSRAMLRGTIGHWLILGGRPDGQELVKFPGDSRRGKAFDEFAARHPGAIIATAPEWEEVEQIVATAAYHPLVRNRTVGARREVPLKWMEGDIPCSTRGIDILNPGVVSDLKFVMTVEPQPLMRQAWSMSYPHQLAFYMRGCRANGIDVHTGTLLCIETRAPYEVVELELTEDMLRVADQSLTKWLEKLRVYLDSCPEPHVYSDWPGYAQAPVPFEPPAWMQDDETEDADEEEAA
jgi:hypothetical protein